MPKLADTFPELAHILLRGSEIKPRFGVAEITCKTILVSMRDGIRLATDLYLPPTEASPVILVRTPYGKAAAPYVGLFYQLARSGYAIVSQDCRGTGDSEPDSWEYYVYERDDSFDLVEWVVNQSWCNGFIGSCGGSYVAQIQWCMAMHPRMSAILPHVGGLGLAPRTVRKHMFYDAYARNLGKGKDSGALHYKDMERAMLSETLAGGLYSEPLMDSLPESVRSRIPEIFANSGSDAKRWMWEQYCSMSSSERAGFIKQALNQAHVTITGVEALPSIFGQHVAHDAHMFPSLSGAELCKSIRAPALLLTGWYDWSLNDALETWELLGRESRPDVRDRNRKTSSRASTNHHDCSHRIISLYG